MMTIANILCIEQRTAQPDAHRFTLVGCAGEGDIQSQCNGLSLLSRHRTKVSL